MVVADDGVVVAVGEAEVELDLVANILLLECRINMRLDMCLKSRKLLRVLETFTMGCCLT